MSRVIRVVIVEGQAAEAERLESALRRSGLAIETHRVATRRALVDAVERGEPDIILWGDAPPEVDAEVAGAPRERERRYRQLFELGSDATIFVDNAAGAILEVNSAAVSLYGYSKDEFLRLNQTDVSAEPDKTRQAALQRVTRVPIRWHRTKDGRVFPVEITASHFDWDGRSVQVAAIRDISARWQSRTIEAALNDIFAAAQSTRTLVELCAELHAIVGRLMPADHFHFAILNPNPGLLEFPYFFDVRGGVPQPIAPGAGLTARLLGAGRPLLVSGPELLAMERRGEAVRGGDPTSQWLGVPLTLSDRVIGAMVLESYADRPVYGEEQLDLLNSISIAVAQVIERKRAEQALRESEAKYRLLFDGISDAVFVFRIGADGIPGRFLEVNEVACRRLGYSRQELLERCPADIASPETRALTPAIMRRVQADKFAVWEGSHVAKDGRAIPVEISNHLFELDGEQVILATVRDISERKRLEAQLRQAQRMEAIGNLAGGVAHEFNNLLQAMLAAVETLRLRRADAQTVAAELGGLEEQIRRGAQLTRQLLIFARSEVTAPETLDLNELARNGGRMVCPLLGEKIALALDLAATPMRVEADRAQLEQLLINLALNAGDAMPSGGTLTVRTGGGDDRVWLEVADTGSGIPPAIRDRIFDPFFTTKGAGRGTGLGLPVVLGIVAAHGGEVAVESEVGVGTTFRITLPAAAERGLAAPRVLARKADELPPGRGERILLVEDEAAARASLTEILGTLGYEVTAAAAAEDVVREGDDRRFDLLLTDVMLPGRSGVDLAEGLCARDPRLRVILMSGYTEEVLRQRAQCCRPRFLQKPFDIATLARSLREALDDEAAGRQGSPADGAAR